MGKHAFQPSRRRLLVGREQAAHVVPPALAAVPAGLPESERAFAARVLNRLGFGPRARRLRNVINLVNPASPGWQVANGATVNDLGDGEIRINFDASNNNSRAFILNTQIAAGEPIQPRMQIRALSGAGSGTVRITPANATGGPTVTVTVDQTWRTFTWNGPWPSSNDNNRGFAVRRSSNANALAGVRVRMVNLHRLSEMSEPGLAEYIPFNGLAMFPYRNGTTVGSGFVVSDAQGHAYPAPDIDRFLTLGPDNAGRLQAWLTEQLNPQGIDDADLNALLADPGFETLNKPLTQLWADHQLNNDFNVRIRPSLEGERSFVLRATHSRRQLFELLVDFWHNHFSIFNGTDYARSVWPSWDRDVIRIHALGNFRAFLGATARHAAMSRYLDNFRNQVAGPNENYARELFELHALGAENYFGVIQQSEVPLIPPGEPGAGLPAGYCDADVYEATRAFTGWGVADGHQSAPNTGEFHYRTNWHDRFQKTILGSFIPADGAPLSDGETVLDLLAQHPGTARYIARRLCRRLISDDPPELVVLAVARTFWEQRNAPDQIAQTIRTLVLYTGEDDPDAGFQFVPGCFRDFSASAAKLKRPMEAIIGALRAGATAFACRMNDSTSGDLLTRSNRTAHRPFSWRPPDGFPDRREFWQGSATLVQTWRTIDWLIDRNLDGRTLPPLPVLQITQIEFSADPVEHTPNKLADFWLRYLLGWSPDPIQGWRGTALHSKIARFMARPPTAGVSPWDRDFPIGIAGQPGIGSNVGPNHWYPRLRGMVALILSCPEFMQR